MICAGDCTMFFIRDPCFRPKPVSRPPFYLLVYGSEKAGLRPTKRSPFSCCKFAEDSCFQLATWAVRSTTTSFCCAETGKLPNGHGLVILHSQQIHQIAHIVPWSKLRAIVLILSMRILIAQARVQVSVFLSLPHVYAQNSPLPHRAGNKFAPPSATAEVPKRIE